MNQHTFSVLEYDRVKKNVSAFCMSKDGQDILDELVPFIDSAEIERRKSLSSAWASLLFRGLDVPFVGWEPISQFVSRFGIAHYGLECSNLYDIACFAKNVQSLKKVCDSLIHSSFDASTVLGFDVLVAEINLLPDLSVPAAKINAVIDSSGSVRDLPELRAIREIIKNLRKDIDAAMQTYTASEQIRQMLQSAVPTQRDGRMVLAVKSNFKGRIKGIVHEVSQTGQTLYVEPTDIVDKSNDITQEQFRLSREVTRILTNLTGELAEFKDSFEDAQRRMAFLDVIHAVSRWGLENRCIYADVSPSGFTLCKARHPLLGRRAVPVDIAIPEGTRILIVTGPNTGGKTVSLKTAGLFVLMNQSGFPVPAAEGTSCAYFDNVCADLGDEQSLDQSLSTFSAHMKNIGSMYHSATDKSLILLDELGSGTDPEEGSALAMSLLDHFIERKSMVIATTHHSILKNYGYSKDGCMNASMEFDRDSLSPTYRMIMGVPGESCALDIAARNGIDSGVIERARGYVHDERADVSSLIKSLTSRHEKLHELEKEKEAEQRLLREDRRRVDLKELQLRQKELELRSQGYRRLDIFLDQSRSTLENLVRQLREGEITREKTKAVKDFLQNLSDDIAAEKQDITSEAVSTAEFCRAIQQTISDNDTLNGDAEKSGGSRKEGRRARRLREKNVALSTVVVPSADVQLAPDMNVIILPAHTHGVLVRKEKNDRWLVSIGAMKVTVPSVQLQPVSTPAAQHSSVSIDVISSSENEGEMPVFELRLLGLRFEDAMKALEHQLDLAAMKNLETFSIVHGKGEGILQKGVHDMLRSYPGVCDYYFARPEDGGFGKTYVHMKR